jgi:hypothetical protein
VNIQQCLLFIHLAQAEGVPYGYLVRMAHFLAAHIVQYQAVAHGEEVPPPLLCGAKRWSRRALELKTLCKGTETYLSAPQDTRIEELWKLFANVGIDGKMSDFYHERELATANLVQLPYSFCGRSW